MNYREIGFERDKSFFFERRRKVISEDAFFYKAKRKKEAVQYMPDSFLPFWW